MPKKKRSTRSSVDDEEALRKLLDSAFIRLSHNARNSEPLADLLARAADRAKAENFSQDVVRILWAMHFATGGRHAYVGSSGLDAVWIEGVARTAKRYLAKRVGPAAAAYAADRNDLLMQIFCTVPHRRVLDEPTIIALATEMIELVDLFNGGRILELPRFDTSKLQRAIAKKVRDVSWRTSLAKQTRRHYTMAVLRGLGVSEEDAWDWTKKLAKVDPEKRPKKSG